MNETREKTLEKVTCFVTRRSGRDRELLVMRHPYAGMQLPGGTIEPGEDPLQAAVREAREETGVAALRVRKYIGQIFDRLPDDYVGTARPAKVYSRPDATSITWAEFPRGVAVRRLQSDGDGGFVQVRYTEHDDCLAPSYVTHAITGWVRGDALAPRIRRHLVHLTAADAGGPQSWRHYADCHHYEPRWAPLGAVPELIGSQQDWLNHVRRALGYDFR